MRVVVTGASGNIGTSVLAALGRDPAVDGIVAVARRVPSSPEEGDIRWVAADLVHDRLEPVLDGADAVIHLAWTIQPTRDPRRLWEVNVRGTTRLLDAVAATGVSTLLHASSVGAYSPRPPDDRRVDERWPTHGIATSVYSLAKAYVERQLDAIADRSGAPRIVRLRPALALAPGSATRIRRLFLGALVPRGALRPGRLPLLPAVDGVAFQVVHADDVAEGFRAALHHDAEGAFNLAAEPRLDLEVVADALGARSVPVPAGLARAAMAGAWHARLHPVDAGWFDVLRACPALDTTRARTELGWEPRHEARALLVETVQAMADGRGDETPPLQADTPTRRVQELSSRQGAREPRP